MATFKEFVEKHGGEATEFRQGAWITDVTGATDPQGKCFAFVLAYLMVLRTGGAGKDFLEVLDKAAEVNHLGIIKEMLGGDFYGSDTLGKDLFNVQFCTTHLQKIYAAVGLGNATTTRFTQTFFRFTKVGEFLVTGQPSYSLITSRVHSMAATSRPLAQRDIYTFFDPNFGEARFSTGAALVKFTADFFSRKVINKGYRPKKALVKNPPPLTTKQEREEIAKETTSLILTVQRRPEIPPQ
jgi:hypothetical protein